MLDLLALFFSYYPATFPKLLFYLLVIKVDFFWINRDMRSFEWFVNLLSQLEIEQAVHGGEMDRFEQFVICQSVGKS